MEIQLNKLRVHGFRGFDNLEVVFESTTLTGEDRKKYRVQQGSIHGDSKELVQKKQAGGEGDVVPSVPK